MKVLVTGATGFIGSHVIPELLKSDVGVIATSNNPEAAKKAGWFERVKFIEFDLGKAAEKNDLFAFFDSPDKMIHLAWENLPNYKELFHLEKNLFIDYFFLKKIITDGLNDLSVAGTCLEYGMTDGEKNEEMVTDPKFPYPMAKDFLRKMLEQLRIKTGFSLKWIRLFYIFGKGQSEKSLYTMMENAVKNDDKEFKMSGGEQLRDFLPVEKIAENIVKISLQDKIDGIINCCSGDPRTVKSFVEDYFKEKKKDIKLITGHYPYPDYEPFRFWGDTKKLNSILNSEK